MRQGCPRPARKTSARSPRCIREGELLALTPGDSDFKKRTVTISKSYQRIKSRDVVAHPKTAKSNRVIQMPVFLCEEKEDYIKSLYAVEPSDRIFTVAKSYLHREMADKLDMERKRA